MRRLAMAGHYGSHVPSSGAPPNRGFCRSSWQWLYSLCLRAVAAALRQVWPLRRGRPSECWAAPSCPATDVAAIAQCSDLDPTAFAGLIGYESGAPAISHLSDENMAVVNRHSDPVHPDGPVSEVHR